MITKPTLAEAQAVPNVVLVDVRGPELFDAYQKGDVLPAAYLAGQAPLSPTQVAALVSAQVAEMLLADDADAKRFRALILVILDEFNAHALKINAILDAIDGAGTLAAVKAAVAAINDYPQRTAAQIKTAVIARIEAGQADGER